MRNEFLMEFHTKYDKRRGSKLFLLIWLVFGCVCLTVTKGWYVYTDPVKSGGAWLLAKAGISAEMSGDASLQAGNTHDKSGDPDDHLTPADGVGGTDEAENGQDNAHAGENTQVGGNAPADSADPDAQGNDRTDPEPEEPPELTYETVGDDYFADAVFIGDSRTVGMYEYGGLKDTSTFYAATGLSVHKLFTAKIVQDPDSGQKITVEEALSKRQFSKIYLMIGINEMGTGTAESFLEKYAESVQHIRELQPDAVIYLQSIMQVTQKRSDKGDAITKEGIDLRNEGIAALADNVHIFYLNVNESVCDETGALCADYTHDGVHLKAQYITLWKEYLKSHAVSEEYLQFYE